MTKANGRPNEFVSRNTTFVQRNKIFVLRHIIFMCNRRMREVERECLWGGVSMNRVCVE